ncbi:Di-copper centre-containing protein [Periconia macrospinosa]|uniref:Di-copper centre-containing protein n=1 Tax=Periconia macrospinosa TaxID=97972 RepID=A0A2V1DJF8_9PLEO|nr:Di-copper centre-containing protein [Periconia macrospinosa]
MRFSIAISSLAALSPAVAYPASNDASLKSPLPGASPGCANDTSSVRREWSTLNKLERLSFISAVKCLMSKPSQLPHDEAPGALNRYDDFVATHINQTHVIHSNGIFLSWHRHFLHLFEKALQDECRYQGTLPYWNWPWWASDLHHSPLFNGSPTSLGGDGYFNASSPPRSNGNYTFPRGSGGGCVHSGPFANTTVHFKNTKGIPSTTPADKLTYAPHCLSRDLNNLIASKYCSQARVDGILESSNIGTFQSLLSDFVPDTDIMGPHNGGHYAIGNNMQDQFASPSDPSFWLHHAMIDLLWTVWQAKDPKQRQYALQGTVTSLNKPPSQNATLTYQLDFGYLDAKQEVWKLMDVQRDIYDYSYEYAEGVAQPEDYDH